MAVSIISSLLLTSIACSLAVPIDNEDSRELADKNDACKDFYSFTCNNNSQSQMLGRKTFENDMHTYYTNFKQEMTEILTSTDDINYGNSVAIERQIYQSCMKLGSETHKKEDHNEKNDSFSMSRIFDPMLKRFGREKFDENITWQELDEELASTGLGHAFFDISVTADPENQNKNIILIKPPSLKKWNSIKIVDTVSKIYHYLQTQAYHYCKKVSKTEESDKKNNENATIELLNESDDEAAFLESTENNSVPDIKSDNLERTTEGSSVCKQFEGVSEKDLLRTFVNADGSDASEILSRLIQIMLEFTVDSRTVEEYTSYEKFTIKAWNRTYNEISKKNVTKINWSRVLRSEFERAGIAVEETENVLIQHKYYFIKLAKYLAMCGNSRSVNIVRSIFAAENVRYYDWELIQSLQFIDKSSFCFEQTQLYGLSEKALKSVLQEDLKPYIFESQRILDNIVKVVDNKISEARGLSNAKRTFLKSELKAITENIFVDGRDTQFSFDYNNLKLTGDYLVDINKYRRIFKIKDLSSLRDTSSLWYEDSLFSINKMGMPRNRFILHAVWSAFSERFLLSDPLIGTEAKYATFGVNMASFLHFLLTENMFENEFRNRHGSQWLIPHNTYSSKVVKCFVPENIVAYGYQLAYSTIAEIFSVRIAFEAMLQQKQNVSIEDFFRAYTMTLCDASNKKMMKKVLSNLSELATALNCPDVKQTKPKCDMKVFEK